MNHSITGFAIALLVATSYCEIKPGAGIQSGYAYEKDLIDYDLSKVFDLSNATKEDL